MNRSKQHKEPFPPSVDLPITPLPPFNPLQEHILRQGLGKNMPMQAPPQYKRPSFHPSGAETDTDLPVRKKTRSPPKTPTQGSPGLGQIRRGNSFNTPPGQNRGFIPGSELGLLGLAGIAGVRARSAMGEAKKEEAVDDERHSHGRQNSTGGGLDGSVGGSSHLSFVSTITEDQWRHMNESELHATEGDDEESDNGASMGQQPQQPHTWVGGEGARTIGLGPGFSGGFGRAKNVAHTSAAQPQGGYSIPAGGTMDSLNVRQNPQEKRNQQPLSQLDETLDFTDNYTETDTGDYGEFAHSEYRDDRGQGAYGPHQTHAQYNEHPQPTPGKLGPNHPPAGTVYHPRSPSPAETSYPPSPTLSNGPLETIEDILALDFSQENHSKRWTFFRQCTHEQWAKYGEVILQRQAELVKEMIRSREQRREAVKRFEDELNMWEGAVDGNMEKARQYMARMRTSFELLKVG